MGRGMKRRFRRCVIAGLCGAALAAAATGNANAGATVIKTFGQTSQPIGHFNFCRLNVAECSVKSLATPPEAFSEALLSSLKEVNAVVNEAIKPMEDIDLFGREEVWSYPSGAGDCEDYVLEKRRTLAKGGIAIANLLITVVRQKNGAGHAVLTVRTDAGDYVLDNLSQEVLPWDHTGYHYVKRQSVADTGKWVSIRHGETPLVGSVH